jgi:hypothetical protein
MLQDTRQHLSTWNEIPEDGAWHPFSKPTHSPQNTSNTPESWPQLAGGHKNWKQQMSPSAKSFTEFVQAFGGEPVCTLCTSTESFDTHAAGQKHFHAVYEIAQQNLEHAKGNLWHETCFVGGQVLFNQLDNEMWVLRDMRLPVEAVIHPQELSKSGQWIVIGAPVVVPAQKNGNRKMWPNMWSLNMWKNT